MIYLLLFIFASNSSHYIWMLIECDGTTNTIYTFVWINLHKLMKWMLIILPNVGIHRTAYKCTRTAKHKGIFCIHNAHNSRMLTMEWCTHKHKQILSSMPKYIAHRCCLANCILEFEGRQAGRQWEWEMRNLIMLKIVKFIKIQIYQFRQAKLLQFW